MTLRAFGFSPPRGLYWACQAAGWGGLWLIDALDALGQPTFNAALLATNARYYLLAFALSHGFREVIRRWGWVRLGWRPLLGRVAAACAALAIAHTGLLLLTVGPGLESEAVAAGPWLYSAMVLIAFVQFAAWSVAYFGYHAFARSQRLAVDMARLEAKAREAELAALRAQVQPHFLFNSLNAIRSLIGEDPARAREAVTALSGLLRASLRTGRRCVVTLAEEMETVEAYVTLHELRHEEWLRFERAIEAPALAASVPPFLLQTLVENACKHGSPDGVHPISIAARVQGGVLSLRVSNPGALGPAVGIGTGEGLRNARERLRLIFGAGAAIVLREGDGIVTAEATIPQDEAAK